MIITRPLNLVPLAIALFLCVQSAQAQSTMTPVKREAVEFPRAAQRAGFEAGKVRAKLTVDAAGNVVDVLILEASPPRVFDGAVRNSLSIWKYSAGDNNRTTEVAVEFKL